MQKYKLTWRDIKFDDFKVYFFSLFKAFIPKKKLKNMMNQKNSFKLNQPGCLKSLYITI